jgi:predicted ATPase
LPAERETAALGLLERDGELAALDALVADAADGRGRLVLIEGPAGIGKSGLLAGLRDRTPGPLRVLAARASELEREFAFGIVRQLFEADVTTRPDVALAGAAAPAAAVFAAEPGDGEGASFATLHGLYWLALNLAAEQPLLLAVDDLHWCDRPSLRFLAYLARRLDGAPVLLATTLRSN